VFEKNVARYFLKRIFQFEGWRIEMSTFLFFTDLHLHNSSPRHRRDDYGKSIVSKLKEVYSIAKTRGVDFVVFGGDFFDVHRIYSYEIISEAISAIDGSGLKTYAVVGQHDLKGYNMGTYQTSTLAFLERHCSSWNTLWKPQEVGDVVLCPCHVNDKLSDALVQQVNSKKVPVLIAHLLLHDKPSVFDVISTESVGENQFSLILSGDLHCGFSAHEKNGSVFCNPGSMARKAISDNREVKCVICQVDSNANVSIEDVKIDCAGKFEDVFDESFVETIKQTARMDTSSFVSDILDMELEAVDAFSLIETIAAQKGVRKEVVELILSKRS
jgi:exonuclease SbcD